MAQYRLLQDCYIGIAYYYAGDTITLPNTFIPPGAVDPLDASALSAFYAAGPQAPPLVRQQWSMIPVSPPVTYWRATSLPAVPGASGATSWQLTGLGANLPAIVA
jgi:hypothetical protein